MFEFHFKGLFNAQNPERAKPFKHFGETTDFLEFLCQIAQYYGAGVAGEFLKAFLEEKEDELFALRVIDWNFEFSWNDNSSIQLAKVR